MNTEAYATAGAIFCNDNNCTMYEVGYHIDNPPPGVPEWLCRACLLKYIIDGKLQLGPDSPAKTLAGGERHFLRQGKLGYCHMCNGLCDLFLDDKRICKTCFITATATGDLGILTLKEASDVVSADVEAPFEVAWE